MSCTNHRRYLMTCEQYAELEARGRGCCEICGRLPGQTSHRMLYIDHEPFLGNWAVRGILCGRCNSGLDLPSVVPQDVRAHYLASSWYHRLPEPIDEPDSLVVQGRWERTWIRDEAGRWVPSRRGRMKYACAWREVVQAAGPYLTAA